ncbi:MAG TPA: hypothetical protein VGJ81_13140 [Thermoanaerobaculia bacterium]|jgi:ABC-type transport system involved in multi-copper enzyme maturation permease subunit
MTHLLTIARREIEERAFVFVAAIAIALVAPAALLMPYGSFTDRRSVAVIVSFCLGLVFSLGLALVLGTTLIGRDLSEKRLSFYLARPVSPSSIWFGNLTAAFALLVLSFFIVNAFPLALGAAEFRLMSAVSRGSAVAYCLGVAVLIMLAAHVFSTWLRSHSPILVLDFVALIAALGIVSGALFPLMLAVALRPASQIVAVILLAVIVAAAGGGAWQLSRGRIDVRRNHRELSIFVWCVVFLAALGMFAYSRWVLAVTPKDLTEVTGIQRGNLAEVHGAGRGFFPHFMVNPATGAFAPGGKFVSAQDGDVSAVVAPSPSFENAKIAFWRAQFGNGGGVPSDWILTITRLAQSPQQIATLPLSGHVQALGISGDGSRAAVVVDGILTIYDTTSRHALASSRVGQVSAAIQMTFVAPDTVRAFVPDQGRRTLNVRDFNVGTRQWTNVAGPLALMSPYLYRVVGPLLVTRAPAQAEVRDLRNPSAVQTVPVDANSHIWFMRDGRQALSRSGAPAYFEIRRGGVRERLVNFGPDVESVRVAGEISDGRLVVTTYRRSKKYPSDNTTYLLDPRTGVLGHPMAHVSAAIDWPTSIGMSDPAVTHLALLNREGGEMDAVDLRTGAVRHVF